MRRAACVYVHAYVAFDRLERTNKHLDTLDVSWVEGLSTQTNRNQYDDRLPGGVGAVGGDLGAVGGDLGAIGGDLGALVPRRRRLTQLQHVLFVHWRHKRLKTDNNVIHRALCWPPQ